jgi:hypothetical protein
MRGRYRITVRFQLPHRSRDDGREFALDVAAGTENKALARQHLDPTAKVGENRIAIGREARADFSGSLSFRTTGEKTAAQETCQQPDDAPDDRADRTAKRTGFAAEQRTG